MNSTYALYEPEFDNCTSCFPSPTIAKPTKLNGYSVNVLSDRGVKNIDSNGHNYYALKHKSEYSLKLTNNHNTRCDVDVKIDGEIVGSWRMESFSTIEIERPSHINRKFTFLQENSSDAKNAGIFSGKSKNGLITITFKPEYAPPVIINYNSNNNNNSSDFGINEMRSQSASYNLCASDGGCIKNNKYDQYNQLYFNDSDSYSYTIKSGATALGDNSDQSFSSTSPLKNYDKSKITTIHLRLVVQDDQVNKKYISIADSYGYPHINQNEIPPIYNNAQYYSP
jgi:hypothetical protein